VGYRGRMAKAMILAAGFGTRLRPLTLELPKPLVWIGDRPAIAMVAERLVAAGVREIVINTHHQAEAFSTDMLARVPGEISVVVEEEILGTGGGVANAASLLGDGDVVVWNGDILAPLDVRALLAAHERGDLSREELSGKAKARDIEARGPKLHHAAAAAGGSRSGRRATCSRGGRGRVPSPPGKSLRPLSERERAIWGRRRPQARSAEDGGWGQLSRTGLTREPRGWGRHGATLVIAPRARGEGTVGIGEDGSVVRLRGERFGEEHAGGDFVGISVVGAELRGALPAPGCLVGDGLLPWLRSGGRVGSFVVELAWEDIGSIDAYLRANARWLAEAGRGARTWGAGRGVDEGVELVGSVVGDGAVVRGQGRLERCVVWPGATATAPLADAVVTTGGLGRAGGWRRRMLTAVFQKRTTPRG
jgi:NDP-sugar pyrophosphorylase family protein